MFQLGCTEGAPWFVLLILPFFLGWEFGNANYQQELGSCFCQNPASAFLVSTMWCQNRTWCNVWGRKCWLNKGKVSWVRQALLCWKNNLWRGDGQCGTEGVWGVDSPNLDWKANITLSFNTSSVVREAGMTSERSRWRGVHPFSLSSLHGDISCHQLSRKG